MFNIDSNISIAASKSEKEDMEAMLKNEIENNFSYY